MAVLKFAISKPDKEWAIIERMLLEGNRDAKHAVRGKCLTQFIANEIYKKFKTPQHSSVFAGKSSRKRKHFEFHVQDDVMENITLMAKELGVDKATVIINYVLNPHLVGPKTGV